MKSKLLTSGIALAMLTNVGMAVASFDYPEGVAEEIAREFVETSVYFPQNLPSGQFKEMENINVSNDALVESSKLYTFSYDANDPSNAELASVEELSVTVKLFDISHVQDCNTVKGRASLSSNETSALTNFKCLGTGSGTLNSRSIAESSATSGSARLVELKDVLIGREVITAFHEDITLFTICNPSSNSSEANYSLSSEVAFRRYSIVSESYYYVLRCTERWETYTYQATYEDLTFKIDYNLTATPTSIAALYENQQMDYSLSSSTQLEWLSGTKMVWVPIQVGDITTFIESEVDVYSPANNSTNFAINNAEVTIATAGSEVLGLLSNYLPVARSGETLDNVTMSSLTSLHLGCSNYSISKPFSLEDSNLGGTSVGVGGSFSHIDNNIISDLLTQCYGQVSIFTNGLVITNQSEGYKDFTAFSYTDESVYWTVYSSILLENLIAATTAYSTLAEAIDLADDVNAVWKQKVIGYSDTLRTSIRNRLLANPSGYGLTAEEIPALLVSLFVTEAEAGNEDNPYFYDNGNDTWVGLFKPGISDENGGNLIPTPSWFVQMKIEDKGINVKSELITYGFNNDGFANVDGSQLDTYYAELRNEIGKSEYFIDTLAHDKLIELNDEADALAIRIIEMQSRLVESTEDASNL
jgi:hypothetical protein